MSTTFHCVEVAKAHEIMARYRPIAPKPALPQPPLFQGPSEKAAAVGAAVSFHLRSRPCRARKRGRASTLAATLGKQRLAFFPIAPSPAEGTPMAQSSPTYPNVVSTFSNSSSSHPGKSYSDALTFTILPRSTSSKTDAAVPVEQDLLQKLQEPRVIIPRPVRPVGSSISVGFINQPAAGSELPNDFPLVTKLPEEVEEEVESDELPAVISDSHNCVRLANSAYKEMVGQPECSWLDSMMDFVGSGNSASDVNGGLGKKQRVSRRISGEVLLDVEGSSLPTTSGRFSCRVKIEWACNGRKNSVDAPCNVTRLFCKSRDYLLAWRFHTSQGSRTTYCCA